MYFRPIFDLFYPHPPKPTFDLFLTYFNVFGVSGPLGGLLLHNSCNVIIVGPTVIICVRPAGGPENT